MTAAELTELIDRRGRFDPPQGPAPVSPAGYSLLYRNALKGVDPSFVWVSVRAGQYGEGPIENRVRVQPDTEHELWRHPERGLLVLDALVGALAPDWACAYALVDRLSDDGELHSRARPWLAWTTRPLRPRPNPPYARPYPAPFPLDDAGPPAELRHWHAGELSIWP
jgi:hypothetical protein